MAIPPIKKNDEVYILNGKDRGKTGRVLIVTPNDTDEAIASLSKASR